MHLLAEGGTVAAPGVGGACTAVGPAVDPVEGAGEGARVGFLVEEDMGWISVTEERQ